MPCHDKIVVGVDVGGSAKGFHAVALRNEAIYEKVHTRSAIEVRDWCLSLGAIAVGVDAPCRASVTGRGRSAERSLAAKRIFSFSTPTREAAGAKAFYEWMIRGWELFEVLERSFPLFAGVLINEPLCFETFPHAVACAIAGDVVSAKKKNIVRRTLLRGTGIDDGKLSNIDEVDAALCALAASHLISGKFKTYGSSVDGLIVVPAHHLEIL
jgi:predicted nuclease with RNAse H fold